MILGGTNNELQASVKEFLCTLWSLALAKKSRNNINNTCAQISRLSYFLWLWLQQALKSVLNCCKLEIVFKCQTKLSNSFRYKDPIPKDFISGVVYKLQCGLCNESYYSESIRRLDMRSGKHIGVSSITGKKIKLWNNSAVCDHILHCNLLPSFDNFSILIHENKKYLL